MLLLQSRKSKILIHESIDAQPSCNIHLSKRCSGIPDILNTKQNFNTAAEPFTSSGFDICISQDLLGIAPSKIRTVMINKKGGTNTPHSWVTSSASSKNFYLEFCTSKV